MWLLNRAGKIPFVISCQGQEAAQVGAAFALDRTKDYIAPYYRDMGVVSFWYDSKRFNVICVCESRRSEFWWSSNARTFRSKEKSNFNRFITCNDTSSTCSRSCACGKMQQKDFITFVTLGEGSSNQGDFHEGANFAGVHKLPVIIMVKIINMRFRVPVERQLGCAKVSDRAIGYGMPGITVDGKNPLEVYKAVKEAADRARDGEGLA